LLVLRDNSAHNIVLHRPLTDSSWEADADGVFDHRANPLRGSICVFGWSKYRNEVEVGVVCVSRPLRSKLIPNWLKHPPFSFFD
jgi:hypothetical protein